MHRAPIREIGVDRDCKLLATGSYDKTLRLWSLPEGRLQRTLRLPIGPGNGGKVFAAALSPDGRTVAAGGWDAHYDVDNSLAIYLFDAASGEMKARVGQFDQTVKHLTFSANGRYLAVMLGDGMRIMDVVEGREIAADRDYGSASYGAAFASDGRLFTVADDGYLRAYDRNFRLITKTRTRGGSSPRSVAVDPNGRSLAVAFLDSQAIEVYRASDLGFEFAADTGRLPVGKFGFSSVAWSADGRTLVASGSNMLKSGSTWLTPVLLWDQGGRGSRRERPLARDIILSVLPCGTGFVLGAGDPLLALLNGDGTALFSRSGVSADVRGMGDVFGVSRDGSQVRFALELGGWKPVRFDLSRGVLNDSLDARWSRS